MGKYSDLLFDTPDFLEGVARSLDVGGTYDDDNDSDSPEEADQVAMASDWYAVGADLLLAIRRHPQVKSASANHGGRIGIG